MPLLAPASVLTSTDSPKDDTGPSNSSFLFPTSPSTTSVVVPVPVYPITDPLTRTSWSPPLPNTRALAHRHSLTTSAATSVASLLLDGIIIDDAPEDSHNIIIPASYDPKTKCLRLQSDTLRAYNRIIKLEAQNGAGKDRVGGEDEDGCDARCCRWLEGLPESVVVDKGAERRGGVWKRILGMISGGGGREGAGKGWTRWHGRKEVMRADGEA